MRKLYSVIGFLMIFSFIHTNAYGEIKVALIGKTKNESFYEASFAGCEDFAKTVPDLTCLYDGPIDFQDPRGQVRAIEEAIDIDVDGLLISTTDSNYLVGRILKLARIKNIPVITFDSDLLPEHSLYRLAYVGTNNFDFGVALGNYAKKFKKPGLNEICLQSGSETTPNLNERLRGVRHALSGTDENVRLDGENGWVEYKRCPFYTSGKKGQALKQMQHILVQDKPPLFLAVAGFAQFSPDYIKVLEPYKAMISNQEIVVISADAEPVQLEALKQNLSTVNIGQRPHEMGRVGAKLIYDVLKNKKMPENEINYLGFYYCIENDGVKCSVKEGY